MRKHAWIIQSVFVLLWLGCSMASAQNAPLETSEIESLVREIALKWNPDLNPDTRFRITELAVDGVSERLGVKVVLARRLLGENKLDYHGSLFLLHGRQLIDFACTMGGYGLMSAVMLDNKLFFTFSCGSGVHRSHVGVAFRENSKIIIKESGAFGRIDLFVKKENGVVSVEAGRFRKFNSWAPENSYGFVKETPDSLVLINDSGEIIQPSFRGQEIESHQLLEP